MGYMFKPESLAGSRPLSPKPEKISPPEPSQQASWESASWE
jgi:hypothetical protein